MQICWQFSPSSVRIKKKNGCPTDKQIVRDAPLDFQGGRKFCKQKTKTKTKQKIPLAMRVTKNRVSQGAKKYHPCLGFFFFFSNFSGKKNHPREGDEKSPSPLNDENKQTKLPTPPPPPPEM